MSTPIGTMEAAVRAAAAKKFARQLDAVTNPIAGLAEELTAADRAITVHDLPTVVGADGKEAIDLTVLMNRVKQTVAKSSVATKAGDVAVDQFVRSVQNQEWGLVGALLK